MLKTTPLIFLLLVFAFASNVKAQGITDVEAIRVGSDRYNAQAFRCSDESKSKWLIIVAFDQEVERTSAEEEGNYVIVDLDTATFITPLEATRFSTDNASVSLCIGAELTKPKDSLLLNQYQVRVKGIKFVDVDDE